MAQPDCMMLMALLRCAGGHVSLMRTAPDAHSPPMPMPRMARHISSCISVCDVAVPSDARENIRIVAISARVRPRRSATTPKMMPPIPDITSVTVPSRPAMASSMPK